MSVVGRLVVRDENGNTLFSAESADLLGIDVCHTWLDDSAEDCILVTVAACEEEG